jgi:glycosyltransferase involved in cell wall biosynthesis
LCVVVCTRDRPELLGLTLEALAAQDDQRFELLIVNQGEPIEPALLERGPGLAPARLIVDHGRGLSRARNLAWRQSDADWLAFVDDDCELADDWISTFKRVACEHRQCCLISGSVSPVGAPAGPYLATARFSVAEEHTRRGAWRRPLSIGHGACMAVRREAIAALGGWDERLGTGSPRFPGAEDEEFNYRLLRGGGIAHANPALQAWHRQWRPADALVPLFCDYMIGRGGAAAKYLRSGQLTAGAWLLTLAGLDCLALLASAARFGSTLRLRIGLRSSQGLLIGLYRGWREQW